MEVRSNFILGGGNFILLTTILFEMKLYSVEIVQYN